MKGKKFFKHILSKRVKQLPPTNFPEIMRLAAESKEVVSLGPGEPDFCTPKPILNYGKKILDEGFTHYSPPGGRTELKEAINKKLKKRDKIKLDDPNSQIIVTAGSTEAILLFLTSTLDVSEEVIIPNPGFLAYMPAIEMLNGDPVSLNLSSEDGFLVNPDEISKLITPKSKVLVINTPSNPTGTVLKKKLLEEIADIAVENDLIVMSDEAYEACTFGKEKHFSMGSLNGLENNVISMFSFSKTFAMPGFRLGYAVGSTELIEKMRRLHIYTSLCAPTISQKMGVYAIENAWKHTEKMRQEYEKRNKFVVNRLSEIPGLRMPVNPKGAFYAFPEIELKMNSLKFSKWLLDEAKVLVVPGNEFGSNGEGFIRISYATKLSLIKEAMNRMENALKKKIK